MGTYRHDVAAVAFIDDVETRWLKVARAEIRRGDFGYALRMVKEARARLSCAMNELSRARRPATVNKSKGRR